MRNTTPKRKYVDRVDQGEEGIPESWTVRNATSSICLSGLSVRKYVVIVDPGEVRLTHDVDSEENHSLPLVLLGTQYGICWNCGSRTGRTDICQGIVWNYAPLLFSSGLPDVIMLI